MSTEQLKLSNQICFPLYSASRLITQAYQPYLDKMNITYPQYLVLMVLWENDEMSVNDVAKKLILKTNTISPLLQRMAKQELLERNRSSEDERCVKVKLTEKGKALEAEAKRIPEQMLEHLLSDSVNLDDVIQMRHQLNQWIEILKNKQK